MGFIDTFFRGMDPLPRFDNLFRSSKQKSTKSTPILFVSILKNRSSITINNAKNNGQIDEPRKEILWFMYSLSFNVRFWILGFCQASSRSGSAEPL